MREQVPRMGASAQISVLEVGLLHTLTSVIFSQLIIFFFN